MDLLSDRRGRPALAGGVEGALSRHRRTSASVRRGAGLHPGRAAGGGRGGAATRALDQAARLPRGVGLRGREHPGRAGLGFLSVVHAGLFEQTLRP